MPVTVHTICAREKFVGVQVNENLAENLRNVEKLMRACHSGIFWIVIRWYTGRFSDRLELSKMPGVLESE